MRQASELAREPRLFTRTWRRIRASADAVFTSVDFDEHGQPMAVNGLVASAKCRVQDGPQEEIEREKRTACGGWGEL